MAADELAARRALLERPPAAKPMEIAGFAILPRDATETA
jgi:hypothetical protein